MSEVVWCDLERVLGLTEAMHGTLQPEDTPGGGLTMVVAMPAATLRPADAPVPGARERSEVPQPELPEMTQSEVQE